MGLGGLNAGNSGSNVSGQVGRVPWDGGGHVNQTIDIDTSEHGGVGLVSGGVDGHVDGNDTVWDGTAGTKEPGGVVGEVVVNIVHQNDQLSGLLSSWDNSGSQGRGSQKGESRRELHYCY